jgi:predicted DNA-binding transcriptional regulator AlpA
MDTVELSGKKYERADLLKSRLGVGDMSLRRFAREGMPRPVKIGKWRYYPRQEVEKWLLQRS